MGSLGSFHHSHWNRFPKYFQMSLIFLPYFPLVHLIPDWLSLLLCLSLIEPGRPLTAFIPPLSLCLSQHSTSALLLFLYLIWCNYLIIPAFCHSLALSRLLLLLLDVHPPRSPVIFPLPASRRPLFEGHSSTPDSQGPSGAIMGLMTGGGTLSSLGFLHYGETDPYNSPSEKRIMLRREGPLAGSRLWCWGVCVCPGWRDLVWTASWHTTLHGTQKHLSQIIYRKRSAVVLAEEFIWAEPRNRAQLADFGQK